MMGHPLKWGTTLFIMGVTIVMAASADDDDCRGGAVFLSPADGSTYHTQVPYPCNNINALINNINTKKDKTSDVFVSYYVDQRYSKRSLQSSQDDDDDDEDSEDDADDDGSYFEASGHNQNNEIVPPLDPSLHVVPVLPTPTLPSSSSVFLQHKTSSLTVSITPLHQSTSQYPSAASSLSHISPTSSSSSHQLLSSSAALLLLLQDKIGGSGDNSIIPQEETTTTARPPPAAAAEVPGNVRLVKLQKLLLPSGVPHRLELDSPHHRCTRVTDDSQQQPQPQLGWLFVEGTTLYALPTPDDISDYDLTIHCGDSSSAVNESSRPNLKFSLFVSVRQRHRSRNWNHAFTLTYATVNNSVPNLIAAVEKIKSSLSNNSKDTDLVVIKLNNRDAYPYQLVYTNESILIHTNSQGSCPVDDLRSTLGLLTSRILHRRLTPSLEVKSISLIPLTDSSKICSGVLSLDNQHSVVVTTPSSSSWVNYPPSIKNQIDVIEAEVGSFLTYKIPSDFCYDPEDGDTPRLSLTLKDLKTYEPFQQHFWMQLDNKNNEIYGLPMQKQTFSAVIVCQDHKGKSAQDVIELKVVEREFVVEFSALFTLHFSSLKFTPPTTRRFIEKLSSLLSPSILVKSVKESNGHVIFSWYNTTNPSDEQSLTAIRKIIFNDEGGVTKHAKHFFAPEFNLTSSGGVVPVGGAILAGNTPINTNVNKNLFDFDMDNNIKEDQSETNSGSSGGDSSVTINNDIFDRLLNDSTYLTTYIVPSILIAVMILLALVIACLLSRKKASSSSASGIASSDYYYDDEFRGTKKHNIAMATTNAAHLQNQGGVPVIFQEELEQQQLIISKQQQQQFQHNSSRATTPSNQIQHQQQQQHKQGPPAPPDYYSTQRSSTSSSRQGSQQPPQMQQQYPPGYHPQQQQQQQYPVHMQSYQPPPALLMHRHNHHQQQQPMNYMRGPPASSNQTNYVPPYVPP